jgi:hypothetical protein
MKAVVRRKFEMATRVVEFSRAHPSTDASQDGVVAKLEDRIARADALITQQRAGLIGVHAATARRKELRRGLQFQLLRYLIRVGEAAAKVKPELAMRFELPSLGTALKPFLSSVKAMLALAETEREFLISVGLSELALTDLKREVAEYEESIEAGHAGRRAHVGASADLGVVASDVLSLVGMLDGLNRHRFRNDAELLAAWESVSKVAGPFRPQVEPDEGPGAAGTSDDGGVVAPAA